MNTFPSQSSNETTKESEANQIHIDIFKRLLKENSSKTYLNISTEQKENNIENSSKKEQIGKQTEKEEIINNSEKDTISQEPTQINDLKKLIQEQIYSILSKEKSSINDTEMKNNQELEKLKDEVKLLKQEMNSKEARHLEEMEILKQEMNSKEDQHLDEMKKLENALKEEMNSKEDQHLDEMIKMKNAFKEEMNSKETRHMEEMKIYATELNTLKDDIKKIKSILGGIQVRDFAKNFLNRYSIHLTDEDKKKISTKEKKRWALIAERGIEHLKVFYKDYVETDGFKSLIKIIESSLRIINEGNSFAHSFNCELFLEEIEEYKKQKILIDNDGKNLTKHDYIKNCYEFLVNYCEKDMSKVFEKGISEKTFFDKHSNI